MAKPETYEGIMCPNPDCPADAGNFSTGQNKKTQDVMQRKHTCKTCKTTFESVQVMSKVVEIKNEHLTTAPAVVVAPVVEAPAAAPLAVS